MFGAQVQVRNLTPLGNNQITQNDQEQGPNQYVESNNTPAHVQIPSISECSPRIPSRKDVATPNNNNLNINDLNIGAPNIDSKLDI